jgi:hypothetical protein
MPFLSPERAAHSSTKNDLCNALSGLRHYSYSYTQGDVLGWYVAALSGLKIGPPQNPI